MTSAATHGWGRHDMGITSWVDLLGSDPIRQLVGNLLLCNTEILRLYHMSHRTRKPYRERVWVRRSHMMDDYDYGIHVVL